jgi:hypothetical protein
MNDPSVVVLSVPPESVPRLLGRCTYPLARRNEAGRRVQRSAAHCGQRHMQEGAAEKMGALLFGEDEDESEREVIVK